MIGWNKLFCIISLWALVSRSYHKGLVMRVTRVSDAKGIMLRNAVIKQFWKSLISRGFYVNYYLTEENIQILDKIYTQGPNLGDRKFNGTYTTDDNINVRHACKENG